MNSPIVLWIGIIASALCYYTAFGFTFFKDKRNKGKLRSRIIWGIWLLGEAFNLFLIINNYFVNGYVPFISMFQVLIFLAACFMPAFLYVTYIGNCRGYERYFLFVAAFSMTGPLFMDKNAAWTYPPALQSPFFVPHILVYMISYTLAAVACIITVVRLIKRKKDDVLRITVLGLCFPL